MESLCQFCLFVLLFCGTEDQSQDFTHALPLSYNPSPYIFNLKFSGCCIFFFKVRKSETNCKGILICPITFKILFHYIINIFNYRDTFLSFFPFIDLLDLGCLKSPLPSLPISKSLLQLLKIHNLIPAFTFPVPPHWNSQEYVILQLQGSPITEFIHRQHPWQCHVEFLGTGC